MRGRLTALLQNSNNCDLRFATFPRLNAIENLRILIGSLHRLQLLPKYYENAAIDLNTPVEIAIFLKIC